MSKEKKVSEASTLSDTPVTVSKKLAGSPHERIVLAPMSSERLKAWVKQVEAARPGVVISRRDLVEWLISGHSEQLTPSEVKELSETHYNELRFLQFAIRELKQAKARGENVSLQDVMGQIPSLAKKERVSRTKRAMTQDSGHAQAHDEAMAAAPREGGPMPT